MEGLRSGRTQIIIFDSYAHSRFNLHLANYVNLKSTTTPVLPTFLRLIPELRLLL